MAINLFVKFERYCKVLYHHSGWIFSRLICKISRLTGSLAKQSITFNFATDHRLIVTVFDLVTSLETKEVFVGHWYRNVTKTRLSIRPLIDPKPVSRHPLSLLLFKRVENFDFFLHTLFGPWRRSRMQQIVTNWAKKTHTLTHTNQHLELVSYMKIEVFCDVCV